MNIKIIQFTLFCFVIKNLVEMKPYDQLQAQLMKSKLPYLSKKSYQFGEQRNHSLKKIFLSNNQNQSSSLNNVALFPKVNQKPRKKQLQNKKTSQTSLQKNHTKWYLPNNNLKKRQKLHTQGQTSQSLTQIQESFVSLTNKVIDYEEEAKDTMIDFKKKIQQNKLMIKKEIQKKNKQNQSNSKKERSFIKKKRIKSSKILQCSPDYFVHQQKNTIQTPSNSKFQISIKQRGSSKKHKYQRKRQKTQIQQPQQISEKILPKRQSQGLFTELQVILDDKVKPQQQKIKYEQKKLKTLLDKLQKFKRQKQYSSSLNEHLPASENLIFLDASTQQLSQNSFSKLKRETNYQEWNKLNLSSTSQIAYRKSSFQEQLKKVEEYTDRNDASLEKYLIMKKQLFKLGFQFQANNQKLYK